MLDIVKLPNENLRKRSLEVDQNFLLSDETQELIKHMIPTMYDDDGIGLAAPQVGHNIRICVIGKLALQMDKKHDLDRTKDLVLVNPVWTKTSKKTEVDTEGCLSVPKTYGKVKRYKNINVEAWNEKGEHLNFEANNYFARVIQHEVDHLNGVLFIDKAKDIYEVE